MASVSSLTDSSSSSIYGNRNVLSGLASGMDTEALIENSVSGYKLKAQQLKQEQEKISWQQDAYRGIIDNMAGMINKYTSYTSSTNLYSSAFFNAATTTETSGTHASLVTAMGKSSSTVQINSVTQMATSAQYTIDASRLKFAGSTSDTTAISGNYSELTKDEFGVTLDGKYKTFKVSDYLSEADFNSATDIGTAVKDAIQKGLDATFGEGRVTVSNQSNGNLSFGVMAGSNSTLVVHKNEGLGIGSDLSNYLDTSKKLQTIIPDAFGEGKDKTLTVNGVKIGGISVTSTIEDVLTAINNSDAGVTASFSSITNQFTFTSKDTGTGSKVEIGGSIGEALFPPVTNKNVKLGELLDDSWFDENGKATLYYGGGHNLGEFTRDSTMEELVNAFNSKRIGANSGDLGALGRQISYDNESRTYNLDMTGLGSNVNFFTKDAKGNKAQEGSFNQLVHQESKDLKKIGYTEGQDAKLTVTIGGKQMDLVRSSNEVELDGLTVTLKGTFETDSANGEDPVTFKTTADADKIVDTVKSFVNDYNNLLKTVHDAYTTKPLEISSSKHTRYEPLTDEDKEDMSETAIANYEKKAKTGLLYGDSDLSNLYNQLLSTINSSGSARVSLEAIGITTTYSNNLTQISLNEDTLRKSLDTDPDKVRQAFVRSDAEAAALQRSDVDSGKLKLKDGDSGKTQDNYFGLMKNVQYVLKAYASTSMADTGVLVKKAGTTLSSVSLLNNTLQNKIDSLETQIDSWNDKMSAKIDYYTNQFTALEKMISTMNNQSSMLAGLAGG